MYAAQGTLALGTNADPPPDHYKGLANAEYSASLIDSRAKSVVTLNPNDPKRNSSTCHCVKGEPLRRYHLLSSTLLSSSRLIEWVGLFREVRADGITPMSHLHLYIPTRARSTHAARPKSLAAAHKTNVSRFKDGVVAPPVAIAPITQS